MVLVMGIGTPKNPNFGKPYVLHMPAKAFRIGVISLSVSLCLLWQGGEERPRMDGLSMPQLIEVFGARGLKGFGVLGLVDVRHRPRLLNLGESCPPE